MRKKAPKDENAPSAAARNRCIWMTAGVISFKLCPLDYDCEHCDFDEAMRSQVRSKAAKSRPKKRGSETPARPEESFRIKRDSGKPPPFFTFPAGEVDRQTYVHTSHLWVRRVDEQRWKAGIDELLAYVLPIPTKVGLSRIKAKVIQNEPFGRIHTEAGAIPLMAPLSGDFIQTNSCLESHPELVQRDPWGEGWLVMIQAPANPSELERLYAGSAGRTFLEEEAQHLRFLLKHRGIEVDHIGDTLPDGGVHIKHLHQVLPAHVCLRLAGELMISGKQAW
jgi:glycine cleavage system H protein